MTPDRRPTPPTGSPIGPLPGRTPVAISWAAAAAAHAGSAWFDGHTSTTTQVIAVVLVSAAVAGVTLLLVAGGPRSLLLAVIAGAVGVLLWVLPLLAPGFGAAPWDLWAFVAALLDGLTARLAAFALRRAQPSARSAG